MTARGTRSDWLLFVLLGFLWGSSYLFIKIGVDAGLQPFSLVAVRLTFGLALLGTVVTVARERLPRRIQTYGHLAVIGFLSVAAPFSLITWAEQHVDSTLAAVINGGVPLFVIVIAASVLPDEPFTVPRVVGLLVGFVGVAILVGFDPGVLAGTSVVPALALIGSTFSYAAGGVYARKYLQGLRPMITALFEVVFALVMVSVMAIVVDGGIGLPASWDALLAVAWLGLLGSGAAFLVFFRLLACWGATRTSMVAYLLPVFGLLLGALVLGEPVDVRLITGTALVIAGIALVNMRMRPWRASRQPVEELR
jgi:drug/metabolite transporter (DMT)-like permease